jgi:hypothetical protein
MVEKFFGDLAEMIFVTFINTLPYLATAFILLIVGYTVWKHRGRSRHQSRYIGTRIKR